LLSFFQFFAQVFRRLRETVENLAKASSVRWHGHVLRRDEDDALRNAPGFKVKSQRKQGLRKTWNRQAEEISGHYRLTGSEPDQNWTTTTTGSDTGMAKAHTFLQT